MKFKKFVKQNYGYILLAIILLVIFLASFVNGKYLLSNDNYSPELNPRLTILRSLISPAWRSYRVLGFASESEQADIFRSILFYFGDIIFDKNILAQLFAFISLSVGTFSISILTKKIASKYFGIKNKQQVILISGIIYLTTLWSAWTFNYNMMPYITQFGFFPLLLLSGYLSINNPKVLNLFILFISSVLFTATSVIATIGLIDILLFIVFCIWLVLTNSKKKDIKNVFLVTGIFIATQLFWILPFVQYTFNSSGDIVNSFINRSITSNTIDLEYEMMTLSNSARFYTRLLGTTDDPVNNTFVFADAQNYVDYDFYKIIGLIPLFFSVLGLGFAIFKKKYKTIPLYLGLFGLLFLIKNKNEPLGIVYIWLQDNIPLFKQVLRWTSSKLSEGYLILLAILAPVGIIYFSDFLKSFIHKKRLAKVFQTLFIGSILLVSLFYAEFLFSGDLFTSRALVDLPQVYYDLEGYLEQDSDERVLYLPPSNNGYFREYEWGFVGSQFLGYVISNPLVDMSLAIGSDVGEIAVAEITDDFNSNNYDSFIENLNKYDISYILVDESLVKGRYGYEINWEFVNNYKEDWNLVWQEDFLSLYSVELSETSYTEVFSGNTLSNIAYGNFIRSNSTTPTLVPLDLDWSDSQISDSSITKSFDYNGESTILYMNYDNWDELPSNIVNTKESLVLSPSIPIINDQESGLSRKFDNTESVYKGYLVDKYFVDNSVEVISLDSKYGDVQNVYGVLDEFETYTLTNVYGNSSPGDCSGGEFLLEPEIVLESNNLGFNLEGITELPCVYNNLSKYIVEDSIITLSFNWEADSNNWLGFCLYSEEQEKCLNTDSFYQTNDGFGNIEVAIPSPVNRDDNINLTIYVYSPVEEEKEIAIRSIELKVYSSLEDLDLLAEDDIPATSLLDIEKGSEINIEMPIVYGNQSYVYNPVSSSLWLANSYNDDLSESSITSDLGQKQIVVDNYINQYKNLFETESNHEYLWAFKGTNSSNIPSTMCLTYQGDDKCISSDMFYESATSVIAKRFTSNNGFLDVSYNSTSFKELSQNILERFFVMQIPESWLEIEYSSSVESEYSEIEMDGNNTFYSINSQDISRELNLITIPQAKSSGWVAISTRGFGINILDSNSRVFVNGWKQGWDITNLDFDNIYVFYYPNLLSYFGYLVIFVTVVILIIKLVKEKKYGRK